MEKQQKVNLNKNTKLSFDFNSLLRVKSGAVERTVVEEEGKCLKLSGNSWESLDFNYSINSDTVMTFEYKSDQEPELSMIVFDSKEKWPNTLSFFKIHGSLICKDSAFGKAPVYNGNGNWQRFCLPIGQYLNGSYSKIAFAIEDDSGKKKGDASFKDVEIHDKSQVGSKTVILFSKPNPEKKIPRPPKAVSLKQAIPQKEDDIPPKVYVDSQEEQKHVTNPFLASSTSETKNGGNQKDTQLCASGVINGALDKQAVEDGYIVESVVISGMTAGLSASYKSLLKMLSIKTVEKMNNASKLLLWEFEGGSQNFKYLASGEVLTLAFSIRSVNESAIFEKNITINVFGTKTVPLILQEVFIAGLDSELQIENIFDSRNRDKDLDTDDLSIAMTGPMKEEFMFQIDTEAEVFSFNPAQFTYLKENEVLEFHFNLGSAEESVKKAQEVLSVIIIGHLKVLPSIVIIQDPKEKKKLFSFLELAVLESNGKVLRDELTIAASQVGSLVFTLGKCNLEFKRRSFSEPELEKCEENKLFTESTKVDLENCIEKDEANFSGSDLKVI